MPPSLNRTFALEIISVCTKQFYLCVHVRPPHALRGKVNAAPLWEWSRLISRWSFSAYLKCNQGR